MKFLITGVAGFIGSHLCKFLLERDHKVIGIDNFITSSPENVEEFKNNPRFRFHEHNIVNPFFPEDADIDWVIHLASPASPVDYLQYPIPTLKAGSIGTYTCLGIAKKYKTSFFLASTSEIYGDPLVHPQVEEYWGNVNTIGPRGVYDEAKRFAESITCAYHRAHQIDIRIARIFNTYGPRMRVHDGRVISTFICQALHNADITIFGDGSHTRSFCYVSDLIEGFYALINSNYTLPVNLGNPEEFTIKELAERVIHISGSNSSIVYKPLPEDDPKRRKPDITKARTVLKWQPSISINKGLEMTIEYFKNALNL